MIAEKLGIHEGIIFGDPTNSDALIEVGSHRRSNYHQINLSPLLKIDPLWIHYPERAKSLFAEYNIIQKYTQIVIALKDPIKRAALIKLIETPAYQRYIAALGLASISSNEVLWTHAPSVLHRSFLQH